MKQEFTEDGRQVDLYGEDDDADVIKYKALDIVCIKYHIEEEQLKHVLYVNFILTSQTQQSDDAINYRSNTQINR